MSETRQDTGLWLAGSISLALHGSLAVLLVCAPFHRSTVDQGPLAIGMVILETPAESPDVLPASVLSAEPPVVAPIPAAVPAIVQTSAVGVPDTEPNRREAHLSVQDGPRQGGATTSAVAPSADSTNSFFRVPVQGRSVVFVLDRSGSMGGRYGYLNAVKQELLASLNRLSAETQFQVIFYNRQVEVLRPLAGYGLMSATDGNLRWAAQQIQAIAAEGATDHERALKAALALEPDAVFFLTDAGDLTARQVDAITQLNRGRSAIHTFEFTAHREAGLPLQLLALRNRGTYRVLDVRAR